MKRVPMQRLIVYLLLACLIPAIGIGFSSYRTLKQYRHIEREIATIREVTKAKQQKQWRNTRLRKAYADADHFYIDKHLEKLELLQGEVQSIRQLLAKEPSLPSREIVQRLAFLEGKDNALIFREGVVQRYAGIQETEEALVAPVEVDERDLCHILARIEGISLLGEEMPEGRPYMFITDFFLRRDGDAYTLNMKLLKREFE